MRHELSQISALLEIQCKINAQHKLETASLSMRFLALYAIDVYLDIYLKYLTCVVLNIIYRLFEYQIIV